MSEGSNRDQAVGPDPQPQPGEGLGSDLSQIPPAQAPTSLSCHPEVTSSRTQWGCGRHWTLFTAETQRKGEMLSASPVPASPGMIC